MSDLPQGKSLQTTSINDRKKELYDEAVEIFEKKKKGKATANQLDKMWKSMKSSRRNCYRARPTLARAQVAGQVDPAGSGWETPAWLNL